MLSREKTIDVLHGTPGGKVTGCARSKIKRVKLFGSSSIPGARPAPAVAAPAVSQICSRHCRTICVGQGKFYISGMGCHYIKYQPNIMYDKRGNPSKLPYICSRLIDPPKLGPI